MAADQETIANALQTADPFCALSREEREGLASACRVIRLREGEVLLGDGDPIRDAYVLMEGHLTRSLMSYEGNRIIANSSLPVKSFACTAAFESQNHIGFIEASCDSVVVAVPAGRIHDLFQSNPAFALEMAHTLARSSLHQTSSMYELMFPVPVRVARYLYRNMGSSGRVFLASKAELAGMMATRAETLSRAFATLKEKGLVKMDGREATILDADALREYSGL